MIEIAKYRGSVLVVGGGVAGLNATLNLAEQGYHVDLVEKKKELGGTIPLLHRLYPICSCCKVAGQVAACLQNPAITVWTETEVKSLAGQAGNFQVTLENQDGVHEIEVGAVILALGMEPFDPSVYNTYAYAKNQNVITSLEFEWLQKPVGPYQGLPRRPSDGKVPKRVAWLQCVGSRDINRCDAPYCSSVCCMYALKEAVHLKETYPDIDTAIFYMDMRAHGKGYERYLNNAQQQGVRLIRSRIHSIGTVPGTDDLILEFADEAGELHQEQFDLVVLSVGIRPSSELKALADRLGIQLSEDGFVATDDFRPAETNIPGIFVCGAACGPRDVYQSVVESTAAASKAGALLKGEPLANSWTAMRDVTEEQPIVGVVISSCPGKLPEFNELCENLQDYVAGLPGVAEVARIELTDSEAFSKLSSFIREKGINRLIYASCSPVVHQQFVERAMREAGLNPSLYDFIDLRTLGSGASELDRLKDLFRTSVMRVKLLEPLRYSEVPVERSALVIGGGLAGMQAALALAQHGIPVTIVEREERLGGHAAKVKSTWRGKSVQDLLKDMITQIENNANIKVLTDAEVVDARGFGGNFVSTVVSRDSTHEIRHGVVIICTGAHSLLPSEYNYGNHPGIYRWSDFAERWINEPDAFSSSKCAVFINCVGSREPERPYCSRLCCSFSVRAACDLKAANPDIDVYVLYRDMRTFGEREVLFREAREKGVIFIRYDLDRKPSVDITENGGLKVTVYDPILNREIVLLPDFISLQTAIIPSDVNRVASLYKVALDEDGFFAESPAKMRPLDGQAEGVFFAGLAVGPKPVEESLLEAWAAAGRAMQLLSRKGILVGGAVAEVNPDKCAVCLTCVRTCPFSVPFIDSTQGAAYIDPGLCQGCGMCVSECPGKAISFRRLSDDQIIAITNTLLEVVT